MQTDKQLVDEILSGTTEKFSVLAERYQQAKRLQRQIIELEKKSWEKREEKTKKFLESL